MPHQQLIFDVLGEQFTDDEAAERDLPPGTPAYRQVIVTMPRQAAKTTSILVPFVDRSIFWQPDRGRQTRAVYSAQNGRAAREKLLEDMVPMIEASRSVRKHLDRVLRGVGNEAVMWKNGSLWKPANNTDSAVHGKTLDIAAIDEAFADTDDTREQALIPAMATKAKAQIIIASTQGDESAAYLHRKVEQGRAATVADAGEGTAYFEWSAPEGSDPLDPATWWATHPALGLTVPLATMKQAAESMELAEFQRAWLNVSASSDSAGIGISIDEWEQITYTDQTIRPTPPLRFALDVALDRGHGAIAVGDNLGKAELVDYQPRLEWLNSRLPALLEEHDSYVVFDRRGPAASLGVIADLEAAGKAVGVGNDEMFTATERFMDSVRAKTVQVLDSPPLTAAVMGSKLRRSADRATWSRSASSVDVSPLIAVALAAFGPEAPGDPAQSPFVI